MLSTLTGIFCNSPSKSSEIANRVAKGVDLLAMITLIVVGILAISGVGGIVLPPTGHWLLIGSGILGLVILALKILKPSQGECCAKRRKAYIYVQVDSYPGPSPYNPYSYSAPPIYQQNPSDTSFSSGYSIQQMEQLVNSPYNPGFGSYRY